VNFRRSLGLDGIDLVIHVGITAMAMVVVDTFVTGPVENAWMAVVVAGSLGVLAWRRVRGMRPTGPDTGEVQLDRIQELEHRVAELEIQQGRVLELEERLDFTERLMAQQRESTRIGGSAV
jgi:hypothetical protein